MNTTSSRQILLDLETTGLSNKTNRIIDIGMIEIVDYIKTDNIYQSYVNPLMPISPGSQKVCGITDEMVKDSRKFEEIIEEVLAFIGDSPIVAHNASFDMGFLNMELEKAGYPKMKNQVIDTLKIARSLYKNNNSLDALCKRFGVDLSDRVKYGHGALLDCHLLAKVYYFLVHANTQSIMDVIDNSENQENIIYPFPARNAEISSKDLQKHEAFIKKWNLFS